MSNSIRLAVLNALAARGSEPGYARPDVAGYSREQIALEVEDLWRRGYVEGAAIPQAFGDNPAYVAPSTLTMRGRQLLAELSRTRKEIEDCARQLDAQRRQMWIACGRHEWSALPTTSDTDGHFCSRCFALFAPDGEQLNAPTER